MQGKIKKFFPTTQSGCCQNDRENKIVKLKGHDPIIKIS